MIHAGGHVLFFALAAAASPLVLTATFVVIRSERPRTNGIAFLSGFLLGTTIACGVGLALGQAAVDRLDSHETVEGVLTLILGLALLAVGLQERQTPPRSAAAGKPCEGDPRGPPQRPSSCRVLDGRAPRLRGPEATRAHVPRDGIVSEASLGDAEDLTLSSSTSSIATVLVSVPVGIVIIAGQRAAAILAQAESWLTDHAAQLRVWLALGSAPRSSSMRSCACSPELADNPRIARASTARTALTSAADAYEST